MFETRPSRPRAWRVILFAVLLPVSITLQGCFGFIATGVLGSALVISDRRTIGAQTEDSAINWKAGSQVSKRLGDLSELCHINYTSFDRNVLITGEVPDHQVREAVGQEVLRVANVAGVFNELRVSPVSSYISRSNDSYITTKVKANYVDSGPGFTANLVKVVTEDAVVYLLGIVSPSEAEIAKRLASTTPGVKKVVSLLDVRDDVEIQQLSVNEKKSEQEKFDDDIER